MINWLDWLDILFVFKLLLAEEGAEASASFEFIMFKFFADLSNISRGLENMINTDLDFSITCT